MTDKIKTTLYDGEVIWFEPGTPEDVIDYTVKIETAKKQGIPSENWAEPGQVPGTGFTYPESLKKAEQAERDRKANRGVVDTVMEDYVPPAVEAIETGARVGGFYGRGTGVGLSRLAGVPVDIVNNLPRVINLLPGEQGFSTFSDYPLFGSEMNEDAYRGYVNWSNDLLGAPPVRWEPETFPERFADRLGQETGAALPLAGGILAKAGQVGVQGARRMTVPLIKDLVESAAVDPRKFIAREGLTATGAGTGAALANEATRGMGYKPGDKTSRVADLFGAVAGAGTAAVASSGISGITNLIRALTRKPGYVDDLVRQEVSDRIVNSAGIQKSVSQPPDTEELVKLIETNPKVSDSIPGVTESLADRTQNPGIAALEYQRQSGPNSGMFHARRNENQAAINAALEGNKPQGTAAALANDLLGERAARQAALNQAEAQARQTAQASERGLQPRMIAEERGGDIRSALQQSQEASADEVRQAWEPINQSMEQVDLTPLAQTFDDATQALSVAEQRRFMPGEANIPAQLSTPQPTGMLDAAGNAIMRQPLQNIREVTGLRSALTTAIAEAMDKAGGANEARILRGYVEQIDNFMEQNIPDALRQQYDDARNLRVRHGDRFEQPQTAVAQTLAEKRGQPSMPASVVPGKFVQSDAGRVSDFQHLIREAGNNPQARNAVRDQLRQLIRDRGVLQSQDAINEFTTQYRTVLDQFPEVRAELTTAGGHQQAATGATTARTAFEAEHGTATTSGTSAPGKFMSFSPDQAKRAMNQIIEAKDPGKAADELLNFANNTPDAVQGARKAFWDLMEERAKSHGNLDPTGQTGWLKNKLREFIAEPKNQAVMKRLWRDNPEQLESIEIITKAMQGLDTRVSARAPATSGTAQGVLPSPETMSSRALAWQRGQVGLTWIITSLGTMVGRKIIKGARRDAIERLTDKALLDPETAALLLKENNPANRAALRTRAKTWMGAEADDLINALGGEEKDDEKDAIGAPGKPVATGKNPVIDFFTGGGQ